MKIVKPTLLFSLCMAIFSSAVTQPISAEEVYDPPSKVARLSLQEGGVSFVENANSDFQPIIFNRPFLPGESVFVHQGGRAELHIGSSGLRLSERSFLQFESLSDENTQIRLNQGAISLRVRSLFEQENFTLNTKHLRISVQEPGQFFIALDDQQNVRIIVRQGRLLIQGERFGITLGSGESSVFYDAQLSHSKIVSAPAPDYFENWAMARDRAEENSVTARYVPRDMVGYQQLDDYGNWESHSTYGNVWIPNRIDTGWAPYRHGSWKFISPWGWTWVDNAPWGFTTCHYGRWILIGSRWAWLPGIHKAHTRPVYAPALVAFSHDKHGKYVTWFPLGPGEIYRPGYNHSQRYFSRLNDHSYGVRSGHTKHITNVYINQNISSAVTTVDMNRFTRGDHVATGVITGKTHDRGWNNVSTQPPKVGGQANTSTFNHDARIPPDIRTKQERHYADTNESNVKSGSASLSGNTDPGRPSRFEDRSGIPNLPRTLTIPSGNSTNEAGGRVDRRPIYGDATAPSTSITAPSGTMNVPSNSVSRQPSVDYSRRDEMRSPIVEPTRNNRTIDAPQNERSVPITSPNVGTPNPRVEPNVNTPRFENRSIQEPSSMDQRRNAEIPRPSVTIAPPRDIPAQRPSIDSMPRPTPTPTPMPERSAGFNVPTPVAPPAPRVEMRPPAVNIPAPRIETPVPRSEPVAPKIENRNDKREEPGREHRNR